MTVISTALQQEIGQTIRKGGLRLGKPNPYIINIKPARRKTTKQSPGSHFRQKNEGRGLWADETKQRQKQKTITGFSLLHVFTPFKFQRQKRFPFFFSFPFSRFSIFGFLLWLYPHRQILISLRVPPSALRCLRIWVAVDTELKSLPEPIKKGT